MFKGHMNNVIVGALHPDSSSGTIATYIKIFLKLMAMQISTRSMELGLGKFRALAKEEYKY